MCKFCQALRLSLHYIEIKNALAERTRHERPSRIDDWIGPFVAAVELECLDIGPGGAKARDVPLKFFWRIPGVVNAVAHERRRHAANGGRVEFGGNVAADGDDAADGTL